MKPIKVVAYHTPSYDDQAAGLKATASERGITVHALRLHGPLTWSEAVCFKPRFIEDRLLSLEPEYEGILYTDADSRFRAAPKWSRWKGVDFSAHWFQRVAGNPRELLTGTMYFKNSKETLAFVRTWCELTPVESKAFTPEQDTLVKAFELHRSKLAFKDLGPEHVFIFDDFRHHYPGVEPVIEHLQASRERRFGS